MAKALVVFGAAVVPPAVAQAAPGPGLVIQSNEALDKLQSMAIDLVRKSTSAGTAYPEIWIRDYNTFIDVALKARPTLEARATLVRFLQFQGSDGNVIDGFVPIKQKAWAYRQVRYASQAPGFEGHKNDAETDQETSLVQAVAKYVCRTGDIGLLQEQVEGSTVIARLEAALDYLYRAKWSAKHGLVVGGTTMDWGDQQFEYADGVEGVVLGEKSHLAVDVYDNAMLVLAIKDLISLMPDDAARRKLWSGRLDDLRRNVRRHLWDDRRQKYRPHVYLNGSPFPSEFDEDAIYVHGGTAVAIQAGLLSRREIARANADLLRNVRSAGASTIGLLNYPLYPAHLTRNSALQPGGYQNGSDWGWIGGRMVLALAENGFVAEAYAGLRPMIDRVVRNGRFSEWYDRAGRPQGSSDFRGEAGVLSAAATALKQAADRDAPSSDRSICQN